jgi:hypothetical protein
MAHIDPLLRRNKDFAAIGAHKTARIVAKFPVYVITCLDPGPTRRPFSDWSSGTRWWYATPAAASVPAC